MTLENWWKAIVPVLDLRDGCAVQAGSGLSRCEYPPLRSRMCASISPGDAAQQLVKASGCRHLYLADLDGLLQGSPDWRAVRSAARCGAELWIDVGIRTIHDARRMKLALDGERYRPIVASESLTNPLDLPCILQQWPSGQAIASIDLYRGQVRSAVSDWRRKSVLQLTRIFVGAGARSIILLDLAAIGGDTGCCTANQVRELCESFPQLHLISGGGVRTVSDIRELLCAGCGHVLVASALHDGRIQPPFQGA